MRYTLYIDESGDFESAKGQWVLAGVMFAESHENCEKFLTSKLSDMPKKLGLESIKEFHLTEFRRDFGHSAAVDKARELLNKLNSLSFGYHFLATINQTKFSLSSREKTYRLMLADLLSLCETAISDDDVIESLDLVVASRTIDGQLQTSISHINKEIINSLPVALEVDLTTKGMVNLIGKNINVKMDYANNSWGLVCADFLANLSYHNRKHAEKQFLNDLEIQGKYSLFESFGGYEIRRANIAERDKDYVVALYRWIAIAHKKGFDEQFHISVKRLLSKVFDQRGTYGYVATFEALIERLWRTNSAADEYTKLSNMLRMLETELVKYLSQKKLNRHNNLLFRLRNMILLVENHLGNVDESKKLSLKQSSMISSLESNPENFQMTLDFKIQKIEVLINSLEFARALEHAQNYHSVIQNYKEVWQLLTDSEELKGFDKSRASIKAEMALLRCEILAGLITEKEELETVLARFDGIAKILTHSVDISRLNNYKIMLFLKLSLPHKAIELCLQTHQTLLSERLNDFDLFWFLRATNDYKLATGTEYSNESLQQFLHHQISLLQPDQKGHPNDLIWREVALHCSLSGNKSSALKAIQKSRNAFNLADSPISKWLVKLIQIHEDHINARSKSFSEYFGSENVLGLEKKLQRDCTVLQMARLNSPY